MHNPTVLQGGSRSSDTDQDSHSPCHFRCMGRRPLTRLNFLGHNGVSYYHTARIRYLPTASLTLPLLLRGSPPAASEDEAELLGP